MDCLLYLPENTFDIGAKEKNQQNILRAVFRVYDLIAFFASYTAHSSAQTRARVWASRRKGEKYVLRKS